MTAKTPKLFEGCALFAAAEGALPPGSSSSRTPGLFKADDFKDFRVWDHIAEAGYGNEVFEGQAALADLANAKLAPLVEALESLRIQYVEEEDGMPLYDCQGALEDVIEAYRALRSGGGQ